MKTLRPIRHKDEYTVAVEEKIRAYFEETLFEPLLELLAAFRVPADRDNSVEWVDFPAEFESLGIDRETMPQISGDERSAARAYLRGLGVPSRLDWARPRSLKPTQRDYSPAKVEAAKEREGDDRPILVSRDGRVVDGHHQWLAAVETGASSVPVVRFDEDALPLVSHLIVYCSSTERLNAVSSALREALRTGRIWYANGLFFGAFSSAISRELRLIGAQWDERQNGFTLKELPIDVRQAVAASTIRARELHTAVDSFLAEAERNLVIATTGIEIDQTLSRIRGDLYRQLERTVPETALEFVEVSADMTPAVEKIVAEEFLDDINKSIKSFLPHEIAELRSEVQQNATAGYRSNRLAKLIESRRGVSRRKAAFLADQETSLFVSKFREARYREIGVTTYKWSTSHDDRVRADHAALDGTVHSWGSPPITNRATGARNHPGEDFRCRCVPIAILDSVFSNNSRRVFHCTTAR